MLDSKVNNRATIEKYLKGNASNEKNLVNLANAVHIAVG